MDIGLSMPSDSSPFGKSYLIDRAQALFWQHLPSPSVKEFIYIVSVYNARILHVHTPCT
jgi:hypothetical protein